ncbi:hypothetical protein PVAP13_2NG474309 [Panicum virgatum]|uniref:Uncharacterized protein n=1 Tax=Panicum virgatum TaxID=38727 RepID=A0A8T0VT66_PANVG|nr:hypothetical protein PVAP13_2NG474309 [Panicum virgatum]
MLKPQGYKVMFIDAFPILIDSQVALDALNEILKEPVPMNRFRPKSEQKNRVLVCTFCISCLGHLF